MTTSGKTVSCAEAVVAIIKSAIATEGNCFIGEGWLNDLRAKEQGKDVDFIHGQPHKESV